jgi:prolyl-tRNA editing enzyme YbaK/EbsC (Cys-tRNA(Pro) deacylase)
MDKELFRFEAIWAATGHPHAVFEVMPQALQGLMQAPVVDVAVAE